MLFETNTVVGLDQIKGVAQKRKNALQQAGIFCLYDLFCCLPKSYEDRSRIEAIESAVSDTKTGIIVKVMAAPAIHYIKRKKSTVKIKVSSGDMTGSVVIFNAPYQAKKFEIGKQYHVFGRIQRTLTDFVVYNPIVGELADLSKNLQIYPVYKTRDDITAISQSVMRGIVQNAWEQYGNNTADMWPEELRKRFFVQDIVTALCNVHLPQEMIQAEQGKERFAFDEIFATLLLLYEEKSQRIRRKNHYIIKNDIYDEFVGQLPFKPTTAQRRAMKEIAQDIKKQDKVMNRLLQGDVGSGKTTLLKQLLRFYPQTEGKIMLGERPLETYSRSSLRRAIGYVPQQPFLFSRTIRSNIELGAPEGAELSEEKEEAPKIKYRPLIDPDNKMGLAEFAEVADEGAEEATNESSDEGADLTALVSTGISLEEAIDLADFRKDLEQLPDGLDTLAGEKGIALSGGQKQRITIARALMKDPEILILDDCLSAVDANTEETILKTLKAKRVGRTTLISSHRISAIMHADLIVVLDEGRIVESGTHQELLECGGWYMRQYERQKLQRAQQELK